MDTDRSFTVTLTPATAWLLRNKITPGPRIAIMPSLQMEKIGEVVYGLRQKVNYSILRFLDEDTNKVEIEVTEDEGWLIDDIIPFDGEGGIGTNILTQVLRGFWAVDHNLPQNLVSDPKGGWDNRILRALREDSKKSTNDSVA